MLDPCQLAGTWMYGGMLGDGDNWTNCYLTIAHEYGDMPVTFRSFCHLFWTDVRGYARHRSRPGSLQHDAGKRHVTRTFCPQKTASCNARHGNSDSLPHIKQADCGLRMLLREPAFDKPVHLGLF